jgi:transcriptional regulator with GAF, ATPase, and Fis domain
VSCLQKEHSSKTFFAEANKKSCPGYYGSLNLKTIDENERDHIISRLKRCNGRISGNGGAAELLKVPPSTLQSTIRKPGIRKKIL